MCNSTVTIQNTKVENTSEKKRKRSEIIEIPSQLTCPISLELLENATMVSVTGNTYSYKAIQHHINVCIRENKPITDPLTRVEFNPDNHLSTNRFAEAIVEKWKEENQETIVQMKQYEEEQQTKRKKYIQASEGNIYHVFFANNDVQSVLDIAHHGTEEGKEKAIMCLLSMSEHDGMCMEMFELDAVKVLVNLIRHVNLNTRRGALFALCRVVKHEQTHHLFGEYKIVTKVLSYLVELLDREDPTELSPELAEALAYSEQVQGPIDSAIKTLHYELCSCIFLLSIGLASTSSDVPIQEFLKEGKGLTVCSRLLMEGDIFMKRYSVNILFCFVQNTTIQPKYWDVVEGDIVKSIIRVLESESSLIVRLKCLRLTDTMVTREYSRNKLLEMSITKQLFTFIKYNHLAEKTISISIILKLLELSDNHLVRRLNEDGWNDVFVQLLKSMRYALHTQPITDANRTSLNNCAIDLFKCLYILTDDFDTTVKVVDNGIIQVVLFFLLDQDNATIELKGQAVQLLHGLTVTDSDTNTISEKIFAEIVRLGAIPEIVKVFQIPVQHVEYCTSTKVQCMELLMNVARSHKNCHQEIYDLGIMNHVIQHVLDSTSNEETITALDLLNELSQYPDCLHVLQEQRNKFYSRYCTLNTNACVLCAYANLLSRIS